METALLFRKRKEAYVADPADPDQEHFYSIIGRKFGELEMSVKREEVVFEERGESVMVDVRLNDKVDTKMAVDTGATLTVISEEVARSLDIDVDAIKQDVKLTLADGSEMSAKFFVLDSISVGDVEIENVEIAIAKVDLMGRADGLLGMSFLKHFSFSMDSENQKLIFSSFE